MAEQNQTASHSRMFDLVTAVILGGMLLSSRLLEPSRFVNVCLFKRVTGLPCMTCGLTRAFHAISAGDLREAVAYHPLSPFFYGLTLFHFLVASLRLLGWKCRVPRTHSAMVYATLGMLFVFWVLRLLIRSPPL